MVGGAGRFSHGRPEPRDFAFSSTSASPKAHSRLCFSATRASQRERKACEWAGGGAEPAWNVVPLGEPWTNLVAQSLGRKASEQRLSAGELHGPRISISLPAIGRGNGPFLPRGK